MKARVRSNIKKEIKELKRFERVDHKHVLRVTLKETAVKVKKMEQLAMKKYLDRPTPRTVKSSIEMVWPTKTKLRAIIRFREWAEEYMQWVILGGIRRVRRTGIPTYAAKLNPYGNVPGRQKGLVKGKNQFIATIQGHTGVWERQGKGKNKKLRLIHKFHDNPKYKAIFPFYRIADKAVKTFLPLEFRRVSKYYLRKSGYIK